LRASKQKFNLCSGNVENADKVSVVCVVWPGGSNKDDEVIACADKHGIAMVFTGRRHFKH
jgi:phosphoribosylaminoimidazolecarboxamide formyltransferase/IMP cyclohydrolase